MNVSTITPEQAWQITLDQLRLEMPTAAFDTWVSSAHYVNFVDGIITIGTTNTYGRSWLASRLTGTVNRLLTGILDQPVEVQFSVMDEMPDSREEVSLSNEEALVPEQHPKVLSLQAEYQSIYDEIVHPDQR
jgi:chromosomal replication initiation ATPase DnaA